MIPVILCGGTGSRLWPLSRHTWPKQFIPLVGELTLLQATVRRLDAVEGATAPIVVCNESHRFMVAEQIRATGVTPAAVLLEPSARGTAPAIAAAALEALARSGTGADPMLLVLPVDQVVRDEARFARAVREASVEAASGSLVTFGVPPSRAETGYGYIRSAPRSGVAAGIREVERFVEKPDASTAAAYVNDGRYWWNSGMFVFGARRYLDVLGEHAKEILDAVTEAHRRAADDLEFLRLDAESFAASPAVSVDRAVMERTSGAVMVPLDAGWADIGSWSSLLELGEGDHAGNVAQGDVLLQGTRDTYVRAGSRLVVAVGVADLVIADTADALLVAGRDAVQDVGKVVAALESSGRGEHRHHRTVHRPWGLYHVVHEGVGFKVKSVVVNPGRSLSLQLHRHRAEHWIVVRGAARVTRGDETFAVAENESTFIPAGTKHRLHNSGHASLEIVEIQVGSYLGEDDIVR